MPPIRHAYRIDCGTNEMFRRMAQILFDKGFVFTWMRRKELVCDSFGKHKYIYVGHNDECLRVFNTAEIDTYVTRHEYTHQYQGDIVLHPVTPEEFLKTYINEL